MKTKFDEKDVPSWCNWIAVDGDGACWAFKYKPYPACYIFEAWDSKKDESEELYRGKPPKDFRDEIYTWK